MRVGGLVVGAVALLGACTAQADIMPVDPATFADGSYVSYAMPGVTLSTQTMLPIGPKDQDGGGLYGVNLGPVYALDGYFVPSLNLIDPPYAWGRSGYYDSSAMYNCLQGCYAVGNPSSYNTNLSLVTWFRVDFATPVDFVSAVQTGGIEDSARMVAFNTAGALVGECSGFADNGVPCINYNPADRVGGIAPAAWTISDTSADIKSILIGSTDPFARTAISDISYGDKEAVGVPEPGGLALMAAGLAAIALVQRRRKAVSHC